MQRQITSATKGRFWRGVDKAWTKVPNVLCSGDGQTAILWATGRTLIVSTDFGVTFQSVAKKMVGLGEPRHDQQPPYWNCMGPNIYSQAFFSRNYGTTWETIPEPTIDHST
jgi:hypothetical protein